MQQPRASKLQLNNDLLVHRRPPTAPGGSSIARMFGDMDVTLARVSGTINTAVAYISTEHAPASDCNQPHASAVLSAAYRLWTFIAARIRWNSVRMVAGER